METVEDAKVIHKAPEHPVHCMNSRVYACFFAHTKKDKYKFPVLDACFCA